MKIDMHNIDLPKVQVELARWSALRDRARAVINDCKANAAGPFAGDGKARLWAADAATALGQMSRDSRRLVRGDVEAVTEAVFGAMDRASRQWADWGVSPERDRTIDALDVARAAVGAKKLFPGAERGLSRYLRRRSSWAS